MFYKILLGMIAEKSKREKIQTKLSYILLKSCLLCHRGYRTITRRINTIELEES